MVTESSGVPSVSVITSSFTRAANLRAASLGMPGVRIVVLPSPLASRPVEDVRQMAHEYAPEIVGLLTGGQGLASKDSGSPDNERRTIRELMGSIPDLTGGLSTEEYMRKIRGDFPTE